MLKCLALRNKCTPGYLISSRKSYASKRIPAEDVLPEEQELVRPLTEPLREAEQVRESEASPNTDAGHGTETIARSPRPHLPLSPLMDPGCIAAKDKHRLPKATPSKYPTPFQVQLAKNPYAHALATPVRMCHMTRTHLPRYFLQDFEVVAHPDNGGAWYVPRSLASKHGSASKQSTDPAIPESAIKPMRSPTLSSKGYALSQMELMMSLKVENSGFYNMWERFKSERMRGSKRFPKKVNFRPDMGTFILELLRRRVVETLKYLCSLKRGYLVACEGGESRVWEDAKKKQSTGAMLWLGPRIGREGEGSPPPGEFATVDVDKEAKSKIAVHNLVSLLGSSYVEDLRRHAPKIFDAEVVVLKSKRNTVDLQLLLWKLQGYLATYEDIFED